MDFFAAQSNIMRECVVTSLLCLLPCVWPFKRGVHKRFEDEERREDESDMLNIDFLDWGLRLASLEKYDNAEEKLRRAVTQNPDSAAAHYNLALVLEFQGRDIEAAEAYNRAYDLDAESECILTNYGLLLSKLGEHASAVEKLLAVAHKHDNDPDAHFNLGNAYYYAGDALSAVSHLQNALSLAPEDLEIRYNLALALIKADSMEQAVSELNEFLSQAGSDYPKQSEHAEALIIQYSANN